MARPRTVRTPGEDPDPLADQEQQDSAQPADDQTPAPAPAAPVADAAVKGLPDQSEIDPYKIRRAVLSRQGWVCPAEAPTPRSKE